MKIVSVLSLAGSTLPEESDVTSSSRQMEDQFQKYKQSTVVQPGPKVTLDDISQMNNKEKCSDTIVKNDRGIFSHSQRQNCELKLGVEVFMFFLLPIYTVVLFLDMPS